MRIYLIAYERSTPAWLADDSRIVSYLKSFGNWARTMNAAWLVKSDKASIQIVREMRHLLGPADRLLVIQIANASDWSASNLPPDVVKWMNGTPVT